MDDEDFMSPISTPSSASGPSAHLSAIMSQQVSTVDVAAADVAVEESDSRFIRLPPILSDTHSPDNAEGGCFPDGMFDNWLYPASSPNLPSIGRNDISTDIARPQSEPQDPFLGHYQDYPQLPRSASAYGYSNAPSNSNNNGDMPSMFTLVPADPLDDNPELKKYRRGYWLQNPHLRERYADIKCHFCNRLFKNRHNMRYHISHKVCPESKAAAKFVTMFGSEHRGVESQSSTPSLPSSSVPTTGSRSSTPSPAKSASGGDKPPSTKKTKTTTPKKKKKK